MNTTEQKMKENYHQEHFAIEERKLQLAHSELLKDCQKNGESRQIADRWYVEKLNLLKSKELTKEACEKMKEAGNIFYETVEPVIESIEHKLPNFDEIGMSKEQKNWNQQAKDVEYLETVKKEMKTIKFEKELQKFKSEKCKDIPNEHYPMKKHGMNQNCLQ